MGEAVLRMVIKDERLFWDLAYPGCGEAGRRPTGTSLQGFVNGVKKTLVKSGKEFQHWASARQPD